jgi:hypothetical protein
MGGNIAGIYGAQIFRSDDKPLYMRGFAVACAILSFGLVLAIIRYIDDRIRKKKLGDSIQPVTESGENSGGDEKLGSARFDEKNPQEVPGDGKKMQIAIDPVH